MSGKTRKQKTETSTPTSSTAPVTPTTPSIAPEVRDELTAIMQELLLKTHELSFEYSTSDCKEIRNCSFAEKSRELFKVVKRLNALVRRITPPPREGYVS